PPPTKTNQRHQTQVNVNPDFALPYFLPDVGKSIVVYISHTENPSYFYVSRADAISEMLSEEILSHYKSSRYNLGAFPSVSPGQIFCAKYTEDGSFYRARVLEVVDSKHIKVQYVDFGNKEVIPVDRLRVLISEFRTQPIQAYECCLHGVQPADQMNIFLAHEWSEAAIAKFADLSSSDKELRMTVHEVK
ncbi:tudor and KH domain-containing, partial [Paramuricea clavata]